MNGYNHPKFVLANLTWKGREWPWCWTNIPGHSVADFLCIYVDTLVVVIPLALAAYFLLHVSPSTSLVNGLSARLQREDNLNISVVIPIFGLFRN